MPSLEVAWDLQEARAAGRQVPRSCYDPRMLQYGEIGSLGRATATLFDSVGRENCLAIVYDDITSGSPNHLKTDIQLGGWLYRDRRIPEPRAGICLSGVPEDEQTRGARGSPASGVLVSR